MKIIVNENQFKLLKEQDEIEQLINLINSGNKENIQLALTIGKGLKINVKKLINDKYGELLEISNKKPTINNLIKLLQPQLDLVDMDLFVLPESIGNLNNLNFLNLCRNNLSDLPKSIDKLKNLNILTLCKNNFKTFPKSIYKLNNLKAFAIDDNYLTEIPEWFCHMTTLEYLDLSKNKISKIPESISNLINLKELYIVHNKLSQNEYDKLGHLLPNCKINPEF